VLIKRITSFPFYINRAVQRLFVVEGPAIMQTMETTYEQVVVARCPSAKAAASVLPSSFVPDVPVNGTAVGNAR